MLKVLMGFIERKYQRSARHFWTSHSLIFCLLNEYTFIFRKLYSSERCIINVCQRKQTRFDMTLAIKAHFSQSINPHLTKIKYGWLMRRRPVICACAKMTSLWEFLKAPILLAL